MHPNEQKQQFSLAYLRAVASAAGYAVARPEVDDDSVDITFAARGGGGTLRSPRLDAQAKCTAEERAPGADLSFRLPLKNYDDLRAADLQVPRILIVMYVPESVGDWLTQTDEALTLLRCAHWVSLRGLPETSRGTARNPRVTVTIPRKQTFSVAALRSIMDTVSMGGAP